MNKRSAIFSAKVCAKLSRYIPAKIVCCSEAPRLVHCALGYEAKKFRVIPIGFDLEAYQPNIQAYESVRTELGLDVKTLIIGTVARFHPLKDHITLIQAAAIVHQQYPEVKFLLCGDGITWENLELAGYIGEVSLERIFYLLGRRDDISRLNAALDIACLSSRGEALPNVIGEAMACGVPCVVTMVGDCAEVVGETGLVVPPGDPGELAGALINMIAMGPRERRELGTAARQRVYRYYNLPDIVIKYEELYEEVVLFT